MSPRAAWRLEGFGFPRVYDYTAGAADWFASGLPREGNDASIPRVGDVARRDAPTCLPTDRVGDVQSRIKGTGWDQCLVVNDSHVVLGRLRGRAFAAEPETIVEAVMENGPTTFRPNTRLDAVIERMRETDVRSVVVTTSDGRLVGILARDADEGGEPG